MPRFLPLIALVLCLALLASCSRQSTAPAAAPVTSKSAKIAVDPTTTGTLEGVVRLDGKAPARVPIDMTEDPACALGSKGENLSESVVANHGMLANVLIYVKSGAEKYAFSVPAPAVLDQRGCRYQPHVLGVMTGQKLRILNSDNAQHNIYADAKNNPRTNDSQGPGAAPIQRSFDSPELLLPITCNQHPWMKMYVNVVSTPLFAVSAADGTFQISGLPPGAYTIEAVHEELGTKDAQVTINPRGTTKLDLTFSADSR